MRLLYIKNGGQLSLVQYYEAEIPSYAILSHTWGKDDQEFTLIPKKVLLKPRTIYDESVAARMSWASQRDTTRKEDLAYCLLGIFDINMPLIYGEGTGAFRRLQEEIIKRNNDLTIFAWDSILDSATPGGLVEMFATSPTVIKDSHNLQNSSTGLGAEFSLTNRGLLLTSDFTVQYRSSRVEPGKAAYFLRVATTNNLATREIALKKLAPRLYGRWRNFSGVEALNANYTEVATTSIDEDTIYIATELHHLENVSFLSAPRRNALHVPKQKQLQINRAFPQWMWDHSDALFLQPKPKTPCAYYSSAVAIEFKFLDEEKSVAKIGVVYESGKKNPLLHVFRSRTGHSQDIQKLFPLGSLAREKDITWDDIKDQAPWILEKGNSINMTIDEKKFMIEFFVEDGKLGSGGIPVTSLKSHVSHIEARTESGEEVPTKPLARSRDDDQHKRDRVQEDTPKKEVSKKETPKKDIPKEATPGEVTPKKETPKKDTPRKCTPKEDTPKKETPKKDKPRKNTPKEDTSRTSTPKKDTPKKETSKKDSSRKDAPKKGKL
ncbi:hypothetical protein G6011_10100 [Alternaria panax]|uniref:DUF8212 domain-containing protein n=1 Tax=Alternaria panax TaxID=48097 RepID=A0AAD4FC10_9PLEO|nr:hypothetical protein G6011_10100 [Alternaria panax]